MTKGVRDSRPAPNKNGQEILSRPDAVIPCLTGINADAGALGDPGQEIFQISKNRYHKSLLFYLVLHLSQLQGRLIGEKVEGNVAWISKRLRDNDA